LIDRLLYTLVQNLRMSRSIENAAYFFAICGYFFLPITEFAHTSSSTHELRFFLLLLFSCVTLIPLGPFTIINSVS
jgi:hypothetical protein